MSSLLGTYNLKSKELSVENCLSDKDKSIFLISDSLILSHRDQEKEIIRLYQEQGNSFVQELEGEFAFILWDKEKGKLILARDRMGIRPLYYSIIQDGLIFSSEIKNIANHKFFSKKEVDPESLYLYFFSNGLPNSKTMFKDIFAVLPGELIIFDNGEIQKKRYWQPVYKDGKKDLDEKSISNSLLKSVRDSLKSYISHYDSSSLGVAFSGGLDSSVLAVLMNSLLPGKASLKTFSLRFKGEDEDHQSELANARKMAKGLSTDHYEFSMSHQDLLGHIENLAYELGTPYCCWGMNFFLTHQLKGKLKAILEGNGIEEYFGGYWNHRMAIRMLQKLNEEKLSQLQEKELWLGYAHIIQTRSWDIPYSYGFLESDKKSLCQIDLFRKVAGYDIGKIMERKFNDLTAGDFINKALEWDANVLLHNNAMSINHLSMINSVRTHYPFLSHGVVDLALNLPGSLKFKQGWDKYIWRKTVEPLVGRLAFSSVEKGFMPPIEKWLAQDAVKKWIDKVLSQKNLDKHNFFNASFVKQLIKEHYQNKEKQVRFGPARGPRNPDENNHAVKIWKLVMFQLWWERHFN